MSAASRVRYVMVRPVSWGVSLRYLCQRRLLARTSEVLHSLLHPVDMKCLTPVSVWEVVQPQWAESPRMPCSWAVLVSKDYSRAEDGSRFPEQFPGPI